MAAAQQLPPEPLSKREEKLLTGFEADIDKNLRGFKEVGKALMNIRDKHLYRIDYDTFEEYCRAKWDMSRIRAHQLIDAYKVIDNLLTMVNKTTAAPSKDSSSIVDIKSRKKFSILPTNERQARPLAGFSAERQVAIWTLVVENHKRDEMPVTALLVQQCVDVLFRAEVIKKIDEAKEGTKEEKIIPEQVQETFNAFLDVVQSQAVANWTEVSRKQVAKMLRNLLETIEI